MTQPVTPLPPAYAIDVQHLTCRRNRRVVLRDLTLRVRSGETYGLLGRNGAGKSTLIDCLCGLLRPEGGEARVLGLSPSHQAAALREQLGVLPQQAALPPLLRVREVLEWYATFYRQPADLPVLIEQLGLGEFLRQRCAQLSGGQRQRLSLALALIGQPRLLILDEPTTGLDPEGRLALGPLLDHALATGVTILIVSHELDDAARQCQRLGILGGGRLVAEGTDMELRQKARTHLGYLPDLEGAYLHLSKPPGSPALEVTA